MKIIARILFGIVVAFAILALSAWGYYRYTFPYGRSHACDTALQQALVHYALQNEGRFPSGESSPEASLSLIYKTNPSIATALRGKTVDKEKAEMRLSSGLLLNSETCDWHYVEGLSLDDDPALAIFWDKIGLGHNGQRLPEGGHSISTISGDRYVVPAAKWDQFLADQEQLRKNTAQQGAAANPYPLRGQGLR